MEDVFLSVLKMSFTGTVVAIVIMGIRAIIGKRIPRGVWYGLWLLVFFRLICPISITSEISVMNLLPEHGINPSAEGFISTKPTVEAVEHRIISDSSEVGGASIVAPEEYSVDPIQIYLWVGAWMWLAGVLTVMIYSTFGYYHLWKRVRFATLLQQGVDGEQNGCFSRQRDSLIYESNQIETPFIFGWIKPKIYLPVGIERQELTGILYHERYHIKRKDHLVKVIAFFIVAIHWFNPVVWLSFALMVKDMEVSCDEKVISLLGDEWKGQYSKTLLRFASSKKSISGSAIAFGEHPVKSRIKYVLGYRKPTKLVVGLACVLVIILALLLGTNRSSGGEPDLSMVSIDNMIAVMLQGEGLVAKDRVNGDETFISPGPYLYDLLEPKQWKEKNVSSPYELAADLIIQNPEKERGEIRLYQSEEQLAMVLHGDAYRYYRVPEDTYQQMEEYLSRINQQVEIATDEIKWSYTTDSNQEQGIVVNQGQKENMIMLLNSGPIVNQPLVNDVPLAEEYLTLRLTTETGSDLLYQVYQQENYYLVEQPYQEARKITRGQGQQIIAMVMSKERYSFDTDRTTIYYGGEQESIPHFTLTQPAVVEDIVKLCQEGEFRPVPNDEALKGLCSIWIDFHNGTVLGMYEDLDYGNLDDEINLIGPALYLPEGLNQLVNEIILKYGPQEAKIYDPLPPFSIEVEDQIMQLAYNGLIQQEVKKEETVTIYAPKVFDTVETERELKILATVEETTFRREGKELIRESGSIFPQAIVYRKDKGRLYLEEIVLARDGSEHYKSVKELCGEKDYIAKKMIDTQNYVEENQQLMEENIKYYIEQNQLEIDIVYYSGDKRSDDVYRP